MKYQYTKRLTGKLKEEFERIEGRYGNMLASIHEATEEAVRKQRKGNNSKL